MAIYFRVPPFRDVRHTSSGNAWSSNNRSDGTNRRKFLPSGAVLRAGRARPGDALTRPLGPCRWLGIACSQEDAIGAFCWGPVRRREQQGNLVAEACFAALPIEHGCEWISTDHDFARFSGAEIEPARITAISAFFSNPETLGPEILCTS